MKYWRSAKGFTLHRGRIASGGHDELIAAGGRQRAGARHRHRLAGVALDDQVLGNRQDRVHVVEAGGDVEFLERLPGAGVQRGGTGR